MYKHIEKDEKKLTDEEIVKAILQSIEYSKTITYFDEWGNCKSIMMTDVIDLINRLKAGRMKFFRLAKQRYEEKRELEKKVEEQQVEIERLTSLYDGKEGFMTSSIGDLPLTVAGLRKAVDEISRLLTVQGELQDLNAEYYNEAKDLRRENTELQKQIDEFVKIARVSDTKKLVCDIKEQAVKDTATGSLEQFVCAMVNMEYVGVNDDLYYQMLELKDTLLKEKYGVEVE